ncbi:hypothetical protein FGSG_13048 [Fusarium graminearum PH-1]|uniref:hypothetical protein n=1 Tax=Gibberella zeae (strain ATCC MYA-4620 / CBS 123657 / FGSC 9075 / NRRL 31084 / PH-1) TaxID=229533 RepID=UPI00021F12C3|nr:hypothetical protein FGSG_13048 [Fusarium graminearum PH-1]ESU13225.1 hypothetical protein FGSG_13048 [Fusarium graminearum PH-1]|eukprot:XP_011326732.1 hypothetical protein FGSG_13048 [Fusarium graminearum PH-1]
MLGTAKVGRLEVPSSTAYPCAYNKYRAPCRARVFGRSRSRWLEPRDPSIGTCVDDSGLVGPFRDSGSVLLRKIQLQFLQETIIWNLCYFKAKLRHMIDAWISTAQPPLEASPNNPVFSSHHIVTNPKDHSNYIQDFY